MSLEIVIPLAERITRLKQLSQQRWNYQTSLLLSHIAGLDQFSGRRVLEIGGTDLQNLEEFFTGVGAQYEQVSLENSSSQRSVVRQSNFMDLQPTTPYDLIVSVGVFEEGSIDRGLDAEHRNDFAKPEVTNEDRLKKLHTLTNIEGYNVIGTISDPCIFSDDEITQCGFRLPYRMSQFYQIGLNAHLDMLDTSELLVIQK